MRDSPQRLTPGIFGTRVLTTGDEGSPLYLRAMLTRKIIILAMFFNEIFCAH